MIGVRTLIAALLSLALACTTANTQFQSDGVRGPVADHHAHLLSPAGAAWINEPPAPTIALPPELAPLIAAREKGWNDAAALAPLYTADAIIHQVRNTTFLRGREAVAENLSRLYARAYNIAPVAYELDGDSGWLAGYFTRPLENNTIRYFGHVLMAVRRESDGAWRIAAETLLFPGVEVHTPIVAEDMIPRHDAAGVRRAAVLSAAYWFGNPERTVEHEYEKVKAENDWTVAEVAKFPDRLVAFISFNPTEDYAPEELARFAGHPNVRGLKLHFANSNVDVRDPVHIERVKRVFKQANDQKFAIAAHIWTGPEYGKEDAEIFLRDILPSAPDVPVQIAHFAGGGPGYTDPALEVFAKAIAAGDPRTKNLYFDVATVADQQSEQTLETFAKRIREVGPKRVLFGTDMGPPHPRQSWGIFRTTVPLTPEEFRIIANNVAPYLR
jgi:predicted TIM-barrel fold metal-dependent hydrolase